MYVTSHLIHCNSDTNYTSSKCKLTMETLFTKFPH